MPEADPIATLEVSDNVRRVLADFAQKAREVFGEDLVSVVLYGSAAEGQMRTTSDVNLVLVLQRFQLSAAEQLGDSLRLAEAAVALKVMFLLEKEVADAASAFALKFADITERHVTLYGPDLFGALAVPRQAKIFRLKQVLLNLILRMREALVRSLGEEERRAGMIAEFAAPMRSAAVTFLELKNATPAASPKAALEQVAVEIDPTAFAEALTTLTAARARRTLPAGTAGVTMERLIELATRMHQSASQLDDGPIG